MPSLVERRYIACSAAPTPQPPPVRNLIRDTHTRAETRLRARSARSVSHTRTSHDEGITRMNYDEVRTAFFDPATAANAVPDAVTQGAPARQLRDAFEPVSMHAVWSPLVHERMAARGLDFFGTYVAGRASVMGEPSGAVVASAFAAFEPGMISGIYEQARQTLPLGDALTITLDATAESLRSVRNQLVDVVEQLDATGRPLFAGVASLERPADPYAALFQSCLALREHRGDAHVASYVHAGFRPVEMNMLTELWLGYPLGEYSGTRAWPEETTASALAALQERGLVESQALTAAGIAARDAIEASTDAMEQSVVDALGDDFAATVDQLAAWSATCVQAATFPPDPRKRAAG